MRHERHEALFYFVVNTFHVLRLRAVCCWTRLAKTECQHNLAFFSGCHFNWYKRCASAASKDTWLCCKILVSEAHPKKQFKTETNHLTMTSQHIKLLMPRLLQEHVKIIDDLHHVRKICPTKNLANEFFDDFVALFRSTKLPFLNLEPLEAKRHHSPPPRSLCAGPQLTSGSWAVCGLFAVILVTCWWH